MLTSNDILAGVTEKLRRPKGYHTVSEIATRIKCPEKATGEYLELLRDAGSINRRTYRPTPDAETIPVYQIQLVRPPAKKPKG